MSNQLIREYLFKCICAEKENENLRAENEILKRELFNVHKENERLFIKNRELIQMNLKTDT